VSRQKPSKAASQLEAVSKALVREQQVRNWVKEIASKIVTLEKQQAAAVRELAAIQAILNADPDLTAIARQMMEKAVALQEAASAQVVVKNPRYVSSDSKKKILLEILGDFRQENPDADGMSYAAIKSVLLSRYGIETASAGLFFRNELKVWKTIGGNRNKRVVWQGKQL
jgi:hypothetical protein